MRTIGWIQIHSKKYGGVLYNQKARDVLSKDFGLELLNLEAKYFKNLRYLKIPESFIYLFGLKGKKDLWVRDFYSTITLPFDRTKGKNLVMVHHVDFSGFPLISRPVFNFFENCFFYRNLKQTDAIVTVSKYWKNYFLKRGFKDVYTIYNSFNLNDFNIDEQEILEFKKKNNLTGKPIVYIGNCQKAKGVVESYQALKDLDVYLVTSAKREVDIPTKHFNLEYQPHLKLLKASTIVVTMSKFKEGWCRTSHEAMLLKTPVIGSGRGGMKELLEGGGQIICEDFSNLKEQVEFLLENPVLRTKMGEQGYNFAKDFTQERFARDWLKLIHNILG